MSRFVFPAAWAVIVGALGAGSALGTLPEHRTAWLVALLTAGAAWVLALRAARAIPDSKRWEAFVIGGAIVLRLVLWLGDPATSDDIHRYVWEGGLVAEGVSPYAHAPDSDELADYRTRWANVYAEMNNRSVSAAYPPLAQAAFAVVVAGASDASAARALRGFFALCDVAVGVVLVACLRRTGRGSARAVVWAWSPLVALEYAGAGHFDALGVLLLVAAIWSFLRADASSSPGGRAGFVLLGAGMGVKLLPALLVPFAWRATAARGDVSMRRAALVGSAWVATALGALLCALLLLEGGWTGIARGVSAYALRWESFNLGFRLFDTPISAVLERGGGVFDARRVARGVAFALWVATGVYAWRRASAGRTAESLFAAAFWMIAAFLVLTPTLHPWYLTWLVPFLAFCPSRAWTYVLVVAPLLYWPLTEWRAHGVWVEPRWLWPVVTLPFVALALRDRLRSRSDSPRPASP